MRCPDLSIFAACSAPQVVFYKPNSASEWPQVYGRIDDKGQVWACVKARVSTISSSGSACAIERSAGSHAKLLLCTIVCLGRLWQKEASF